MYVIEENLLLLVLLVFEGYVLFDDVLVSVCGIVVLVWVV